MSDYQPGHSGLIPSWGKGNSILSPFYNNHSIMWCVLCSDSGAFICRLRYLVIAVLHILAFFEFPSSLSWTSDITTRGERTRFPCGVTETIEILCLLLLIADAYIKVKLPVAFEKNIRKINYFRFYKMPYSLFFHQ